MIPEQIVLRAIVGSHAYGLAREGSDVDHKGIFVTPTQDLLGLRPPGETWNVSGPEVEVDSTFHEVRKFITLALKGNPSILELLYVPDELVLVHEWPARMLRQSRWFFLSDRAVRNGFGGYAIGQARKLAADGRFPDVPRSRISKHARHCFRLLRQGRQLLEEGVMTLKVRDPETYWAFDDMPIDEITKRFEEELIHFNEATSVLPSEPNEEQANTILLSIRETYKP